MRNNHKMLLQVVDLAFSAADSLLASLGGNEDGNRIIIWDVKTGNPIREQVTRCRFVLMNVRDFSCTTIWHILTRRKDTTTHSLTHCKTGTFFDRKYII